MRLTAKQQNVLGALEHHAELPISDIARGLRMRSHNVRYQLESLKVKGLVVAKTPFIDIYRLGYTDFTVFFTVSTDSKATRTKLLEYFLNNENVSWVAHLGGEYQYGVSVLARHVVKVHELLLEAAHKFGNIFAEKGISIRISFHAFGRKYLNQSTKLARKTLTFEVRSTVECDATDRRILAHIANEPFESLRALARDLDLAFATLNSRIKRLEKAGVIPGYIYRLRLSDLGALTYRILIYGRGIDQELSKKLYDYAKKHPHILHFIECVGAWDFELGLEIYSSEQLNEVLGQLYDNFGGSIGAVKTLQIFKHLKYSGYPFSETKSSSS